MLQLVSFQIREEHRVCESIKSNVLSPSYYYYFPCQYIIIISSSIILLFVILLCELLQGQSWALAFLPLSRHVVSIYILCVCVCVCVCVPVGFGSSSQALQSSFAGAATAGAGADAGAGAGAGATDDDDDDAVVVVGAFAFVVDTALGVGTGTGTGTGSSQSAPHSALGALAFGAAAAENLAVLVDDVDVVDVVVVDGGGGVLVLGTADAITAVAARAGAFDGEKSDDQSPTSHPSSAGDFVATAPPVTPPPSFGAVDGMVEAGLLLDESRRTAPSFIAFGRGAAGAAVSVRELLVAVDVVVDVVTEVVEVVAGAGADVDAAVEVGGFVVFEAGFGVSSASHSPSSDQPPPFPSLALSNAADAGESERLCADAVWLP